MFRRDRGQRFRAVVDAPGMRESEYLIYLNGQNGIRRTLTAWIEKDRYLQLAGHKLPVPPGPE